MSKRHNDADAGKGPQTHAEGQHGDKAHRAFLDNLHNPQNPDTQSASDGSNEFDEFGRPRPGHHRRNEEREQHDPAERASELKDERR